MSFFSDLGNVFHSIGHFISGGDSNNNSDSNQPQQNNNNNNQPNIIRPSAPQQNNQPLQVQQQPQAPMFNLYQGPQKANGPAPAPAPTPPAAQPKPGLPQFNINDLTNGSLVKAQPSQQPAPAPAPSKPGIPFWKRAVNDVGNVASGAAGASLGVLRAGEGLVQGVTDIPKMAVDLGSWGGNEINKAMGNPTVKTGLQRDVDQWTNDIDAPQKWLQNKTDQAALAYGHTGEDIYKPAQVAANVATLVPAAEALVSKVPGVADHIGQVSDFIDAQKGLPTLSKAADWFTGGGDAANAANKVGTATDTASQLTSADKTPDEIAVGIKSANPNQGADALTAIQQKEAEAAANAPTVAGQEPAPTGQPQPSPQPQPPAQDLQGQGAPTSIQPAQNPQVEPQSELKVSSPNNVPQGEQIVNPSGETAPNAPNVRQQLVQQLGDAAGKAGDVTQHDVLSNADLKQAADRVVQATPPQELVTKYNGVPNLSNAADLAHAHSSLQPLAELSKSADPELANGAKQAIDNIIEGSEKGVSNAGRTMNYTQGMYDSLPTEAKVSLTVRTLDKAREAAGMPLIRDNPALQNEVEAKLNNLISTGEDLRNQLAGVEGKVQEIMDSAKNGQVPDGAKQTLNDLQKQQSTLEIQSQAQNGQTARYYNSLVPGKAGLQNAADWARTSMLTAPSGRINNIFNVGGNSLYEIARSIPQSVLNKAINFFGDAGTTEGKSLFNKGLVTGVREGAQETAAQFKGNALLDDLTKAPKAGDGGTYEMVNTNSNSGLNKVKNVVQAAVKAPSNIIGGGIKNAQLVRSAAQEAAQLGLTGDEADIYTQARSIIPSKQMVQKAQDLQDVVSHMNKNPLADVFSKFGNPGQGSSQAQGAMGLIKNTFLPFPKYAATFAWNTLTDRNVIADTVRMAGALKDGDLNALTRAISGGALDTTGMYVGYHLTKMGLITNKDGSGYSDGGAYLHIGNRFIPLGFLGVNGAPLLAGNAMFNATSGPGNHNPADVFVKTVANTTLNTIKMAGATSLVGADNQGLTALQRALTGSDNVSPTDAAAVLGGQAASQFIPGATTDLNSILNQTGLNPTGEAPQTKIEKGASGVTTATGAPSTAKNIPASELQSIKSRVPFLSQSMPRAPGTTANDFVDRVTRGDHIGTTQAVTLQKAADQKTSIDGLIKAGVPVYQPPKGTAPAGYSFNNTMDTAVQTGAYDKALQGLQDELKTMNQPGPAHIPPSTKQAVQDKITQLQVATDKKLSYSDIQQYNGTTLTQWRAMGDPTSDQYDPTTYQKLYEIDQALADKGVAGAFKVDSNTNNSSSKMSDKPKYSLSAASSKSSASKAASLVKSNTIGSLPTLARENFVNNLAAPPIALNLPEAKLTQPDQLIKAHKISVGMPKA